MAGSQVLPPGTDGPADGCSGQVPIVVGSDLAAQSDLYSAVTLAGVIDTSCIVLAGPRDGEMPADQVARLDAAADGGWVMGGEAAVPEAKIAGRGLKRLNGVDRWHTARLAGAIALDPDGDVAALTAATAPAEGELGGGSVIVDGAEVRLPPGLDASCEGQVPIVVAVDAAAQSDLYSAATLAGVIDTTCYVLAGPRSEPMSAEQQGRLTAALGTGGWIVGGEAAVPPSKVAGFTLTRIGGADRWETARLIGEAAVAQAARNAAEPAVSTTTTTEAARSAGGSSGGGSARSSGGGSSRRVSSGGGGGVSRPTTGPSTGPSTRGTPTGGIPPSGTTTTSMPGDTMPGDGGTTSLTEPGATTPGDGGTTSPTAPGPGDATTTSMPGGSTMSGDTTTTTTAPGATDTTMPGGTMETTTTSMPGDTTTTTQAGPGDTTSPTVPGSGDTTTTTAPTDTTTTEPPSMASMFVPSVSVEVPQLGGTSGANIWSGETFEVRIARASGANDECSLQSSQTVTFTVQSDGTVADDGSAPATLIGTTATGAMCSYTVTFPAPPTDSPGGDYDWMMSPAAATEATLSDATPAANSATATYSVGDVTFDPDATITVPAGNDGAAFDVDFTSTQANCSGHPSAVTLTYTVPAGGTSAQPDTGTNPSLIAYPTGATASTDVCNYTVAFPTNENGAAMALTLQTISPAPSATVSGNQQAISATYVPALKGVSSGGTFSCALQSDGAVFCWGDNTHNQLVVPPLEDGGSFTQVSVGGAHACGLKSSGAIACWGDNEYGQTTATDLTSGATYTQVSAGWQHSCGLTSDETIECWGRNSVGQTRLPSSAAGETFTQVSAGGSHSCAVKSDRSVVCWGESSFSGVVSPIPSGSFVSVSVGGFYVCGVKTDGAVECWGIDSLGRATAPAESFVSVAASLGGSHTCGLKADGTVACWGGNAENQGAVPSESFAAVSAGRWHSCGLKLDGSVSCWGYGNLGQAASLSGTFSAVSSGAFHNCGIKTDDTTECWGANDSMQTTVPLLGASESFTQLAAGTAHTCGVKNDSSVACWGFDGRTGSEDGRVSMAPGGSFAAVTAGDWHSCGIRSGGPTDGEIVCWGDDRDGKLTPPPLAAGEAFAAVDAGLDHTCALKRDGSVACWGSNGFQADGRVSDAPSEPTDLFAALAVGNRHACAVLAADGTVDCWGDNAAFQSTPPTGAFSAVAAGGDHTCGIRSGGPSSGGSGGESSGAAAGTVACWGSNADGQSDAPEGTFSALAAGTFHTCGIRSGGPSGDTSSGPSNGGSGGGDAGAVVCWGAGTAWQLIIAPPASSQ